jgi:hypothetical protein
LRKTAAILEGAGKGGALPPLSIKNLVHKKRDLRMVHEIMGEKKTLCRKWKSVYTTVFICKASFVFQTFSFDLQNKEVYVQRIASSTN